LAALAHFDIAGLSDKLNSVLNRLDTSLSELNVRDINAGVTNLLTSANRMVASADLSAHWVTEPDIGPGASIAETN
jgi:hypothetical protein